MRIVGSGRRRISRSRVWILLPVVRDSERWITHVGLIRRNLNGHDVWCHVGGRVRLNEPILVAATRHLDETLGVKASSEGGFAEQLFTVLEYFSENFETSYSADFDPRKHAILNCYLVEHSNIVPVQPAGEASDFIWFTVVDLPPRFLQLWVAMIGRGSWQCR